MTRPNVVLRWVLVLLAMALAIPSSAFAQIKPVRVYVFTAVSESGFVDADSKGRNDSVKDILRALNRMKKTLVPAADAASSEITLEVKRRGYELADGTFIGTGPLMQGGGQSKVEQTGTVRTMLTVGEYTTEIVGKGGRMEGVWRIAAGQVANLVDKWVKDNHTRVPRK